MTMAVLGIGGLFFRARDPKMLTAWYREHLNIGPGCSAQDDRQADEWCWMAQGGPIVFSPFKEDTDYFGREKAFMLNLRVRDLAQMISRLTGEGIEVTTREEWNHPDVGRFARIHDPEGNPVELWEPPAKGS
jgi:predicted enzyme related to lactoylglutathione lyase